MVSAAARWGLRLTGFAALSLLGVLRWEKLLSPAPSPRLLALVLLALLIAGPLGLLARRSRRVASLAAGLAMLAVLPLVGMPLSWLAHLRLGLAAQWLGDGLGTLPSVLVPYEGSDPGVRAAILLGAALLLLAGALILAFAPRPLRLPWLIAAALGPVVLIALPSTFLAPRLPGVEGMVVFAAMSAILWADRVRNSQVPVAAALTALALVLAALLSPTLEAHRPWLNVQRLAGRLSGGLEQFDFAQRFGPLRWPRTGREMFDVRASRPDLWKAESLDLFDGRGFVEGIAPSAPLPGPDPAIAAQSTQTLQVTIRGMQTSLIVAAGDAAPPTGLREAVQPGAGAGTWTVRTSLGPGDGYTVRAVSPVPTAEELTRAGAGYPLDALAPYRSILLPSADVAGATTPILFAPFHGGATTGVGGSPYARAYALAQRLANEAPTPSAFVASVLKFLHRGFTYDENPPERPFPLESFLFGDRRGYCQQFSGAMALLLRMGGLPARVAAGFTSGHFDPGGHRWIVSDLDAHDWVEVWFPHWGWVHFDPTPGSAPAHSERLSPVALGGSRSQPLAPRSRQRDVPAAPPRRRPAPAPAHSGAAGAVPVHRGAGWSPAAVALIAVVLATLIVAAGLSLRAPADHPELLVAELERALRPTAHPLRPDTTLSTLERQLQGSQQAAEYIRSLRLARYAGHPPAATAAGRRALRAHLRKELGPFGWLRALWALPPRRTTSARRRPSNGDLHFGR